MKYLQTRADQTRGAEVPRGARAPKIIKKGNMYYHSILYKGHREKYKRHEIHH
jgi:hypothetical protein